ncbi:MAG: helix-turn-helix domain-containing protein [Bacteroidota bacterium]
MECGECLIDGLLSGMMLMACLHGLLLAGIFLFHPRFNAKSNQFLAMAILGVCVMVCYEFFAWTEMEDYVPAWVDYIPFYIRSTIPVGLAYFTLFLINPKHQLSTIERLGIWAIGLEVFLHLLFVPIDFFFAEAENLEDIIEYLVAAGWLLGIIVCLILLPLAIQRVNRYQKYLLDNYSNTHKRSLAWLRHFLSLVLGLSVLQIISLAQFIIGYEEAGEFTFLLITLGFIILLFWIGYALILNYGWFQIVPIKESSDLPPNTSTKLSSKTNIYHHQLLQLLQEEKAYEDTDLTLDRLSEQLDISSGYLSQIINEKEGKNFFDLINHYRIQAVKERLLDQEFANYTIMGIALECGFKSKSTFNAVFKKFTGLTPSSYRKMHV